MQRTGGLISLDWTERAFAQLGQRLSATSDAETAASIIMEVADELLGWDACYVLLYDPEQGDKPRPLLAMDVVNGQRTRLLNVAPQQPSPNMLKAIAEDGFIKQSDAPANLDPAFMFGDANRRADSGMFVPIRSGGRVIGVLSIQRYVRNAYTDDSLLTLKALANHCAGALERIWAQEKLSQMAERRAILYNATKAISASLNTDQLYDAVYNAVKQVMPCDDFVIAGYDAPANEIIILYDVERLKGRIYPPAYFADHGLAGLIVHTGQSRIFNSIEEMDASGIKFVVTEEDRTQSIVAVPLLLYGKVNGMISAQAHQPNSYKEDDRELLEMLAAHTAIAIENARLFAELQKMADNDPLTDLLYNRRKFYELAEREFSRSQRYPEPLSVIMLDVDHFKNFNDRFGHKVGDMMLRMIAEKCRQCVRDVDIIGRHGGEEFAILLPATGLERAMQVAERLRQTIERADLRPMKSFYESVTGQKTTPRSMRTTISAGVAEFDATCNNLDVLIDHADRAMYSAKNDGRNCVRAWQKTN
jgi:diguanylate cyclase (GGDEF)-like protein